MPSARQIAANRRNAAKSTGPRTDAGKRASSLNAYTHGLISQILVMTDEQAEAYERFTDAIVQDLRAVGAMEIQIARSIADTEWRINRAAAIENNIFNSEASYQERAAARNAAERGVESSWGDQDRALANVHSFVDRPERFHLLTTYEMRLHRKAQLDLKQLRDMQAVRRADENERVKAAAMHAERNKAAAEPGAGNHPQPEAPAPEKTLTAAAASPASQTPESTILTPENGFVFFGPPSEADIRAFIDAVPPGVMVNSAGNLTSRA